MPVLLRLLAPSMVDTLFQLPARPLRHHHLLKLRIFHLFPFQFQPLSLTVSLVLRPVHLVMSTLVHSPLPPNYLLNWPYPYSLLALRTSLQSQTIESLKQGTLTDL